MKQVIKSSLSATKGDFYLVVDWLAVVFLLLLHLMLKGKGHFAALFRLTSLKFLASCKQQCITLHQTTDKTQ